MCHCCGADRQRFTMEFRAFTQTLNLINAAEVHHRMRILRNTDRRSNRLSPLPMREDSVAGTIDTILKYAVDGGTSETVRLNHQFHCQIVKLYLLLLSPPLLLSPLTPSTYSFLLLPSSSLLLPLLSLSSPPHPLSSPPPFFR